MNKIKDGINIIKENSFMRIMIELIIGCLLFNINQTVVGIVFLLILSFEIIKGKEEDGLFIYLFLSFFDEVLKIEQLGGSISRIAMAVIFIKLAIYIIKNRIKPNRYQIGISIFFLISLTVGIVTYKTLSMEVAIIMANIAIFILFSMSIKLNSNEETERFIEKLLTTIVFAVLTSIFYGMITNNFLKEIEGSKISYRFKGTYEPNFMCMYINLGIISILAIKKNVINKPLSYLIAAIMINANIATVSMTGLATFAISIFIYLILKRKNLKEEIIDILIIGVVSLIIMFGIKISDNIGSMIQNNNNNNMKNATIEENIVKSENIIEDNTKTNITIENNSANSINANNTQSKESSVENRLSFLKEVLENNDLDRFSSGRIPLMKTFISESINRPIGNVLFGNDASTKKLFSDYFFGYKYSHNSYLDILYNFGIVGILAVIVYVYIIIRKNIYLGKNITYNKYNDIIKMIRIMLLIYAFALSLYTKRMFLIFFLL